MKKLELQDLMKAGLHFGHRPSAWCPKMKPFLFGTKAGVHIIDLEQTLIRLEAAAEAVRQTVGAGGNVLFVGTKPQAKKIIAQTAKSVDMPYVTERWLGGTITNFKEIFSLVKKLEKLITESTKPDYEEKYTKRERLVFAEEIDKLQTNVGGIANLRKIPDLIFIASVKNEKTAVAEAAKKNIPIVGVCDSNADPKNITQVIPANDDALKSIAFIANYMAQAVEQGQKEYQAMLQDKPQTTSATPDQTTSNT